MGIPAINQLANMEFLLYGSRAGMNANCPNYYNGYKVNMYNNGYMNYYNPVFRGYGNYNTQDIFTQANDATGVYNQNKSIQDAYRGTAQVDWSNPQFKGLSDDLNELGDYYVKNSAPSESLMGAAVGGAAFGLMNNPRTIVHPWNTLKTTLSGNVNKVFADIKTNGSNLNKLYNNQALYKGKTFTGGYELVSEAYARMNRLESLKGGKLGWFRRSLSIDKHKALLKEAEKVEKNLAAALKAGNIEEIAKYTEEAKRIGNRFTGFIPQFMKWAHIDKPFVWLRKKFINPTHYEKDVAKVAAKNIESSCTKSTLRSSLKHSCGVGNGLLFAALEFVMDIGKIQTAFSKDSSTGMTQVGQTALKGAGSAIGWAVGEGIGAWAGAKLGMMAGAKLGTVISPGVGTAIGAVAGLIGGSIGCWLLGKVTHKIAGQDVGTKVEVENMKKTAQGQQQLLQLTLQQAQDDKKLSARTQNAIKNVANFYGAGGQ